jgi:hypothetical protein
VLEIEFEPPHQSEPCECCGFPNVSLTRFVLEDGDAHAVCYMRFSEGHPDRIVKAAVSIGPWWDGTTPSDRTAFALELRSGPENFEVSVRDAAESPWQGVESLGLMLDREEALAHPLCAEAFHITDHLFEEDEPLRAYLLRTPAA